MKNHNQTAILTILLTMFSFGSFAQCLPCNLTGWQYMKEVVIDNSGNGNTLTDYQVLINTDTQTPISQGKMDSQGADIRFTINCSTMLDYWIESGINTANTLIWVKIPSIPANSTDTIFMHYGNPAAADSSNGFNTFVLFDDFEDGNTNGWTFSAGTWSVTNFTGDNVLFVANPPPATSNGATALLSTNFGLSEYIIDLDYYPIVWGWSYGGPLFEHDDFNNFYAYHSMPGWDEVMHTLVIAGVPDLNIFNTYTHTNAQWYDFSIERAGPQTNVYFDNTYINSVSQQHSPGAGVWAGDDNCYFDDFRVRKYTSPEPSNTISSELVGDVPSASLTTTNVSCFGDSTGSADLTVSNGTPPYTYSWSNTATTEDISSISAGTYLVTITDLLGCSTIDSVTITESPAITATLTSTPDSTGNCVGTTTVTPGGGTPGYTYQWDDPGSQATPTATGLCAGNYCVTITDANSCTKDTCVSVAVGMDEAGLSPNDIRIYPNPSNGKFIIEIYLKEKEEIEVRIVDVLGRDVKKISIAQPQIGTNRITVNLNGYAKGIYEVQIITAYGSISKEMVLK